jgi:glycosyltransferase involved in cell wall biosynthesis
MPKCGFDLMGVIARLHLQDVSCSCVTRPLFSIVTPALNCGDLLRRNLASVHSQGLDPDEMEHWVIDGGSTDGTLALLRQNAGVKYISEEDRGLSDAVNKGIQRARGEWIIWLNADDELAPGALMAFKTAIKQYPDNYLFCGRQKMFRYDGTLYCIQDGWDYNLEELLGTRTTIIQASTFVHRSVYEKVGLLDVNCRDAMDYEWIVRAAHHYRCQPLPIILTHYHRRKGSIMDANRASFYRTFLQVRRRHGLSYLAPGEWRIRLYLMTEPLRRIVWLRRMLRRIKSMLGFKPLHPIS